MKKTILGIIIVLTLLASCGKADEVKLIETTTSEETTIKKNVETIEETTTMSETNNVTTSGKSVGSNDLDAELLDIEHKYSKLDSELQSLSTQQDMNVKSLEIFKLWDDELNSLWKRIKAKDNADSFNKLKAEENAWIKDKETKVKEAGKEYENGSMYSLVVNEKAAELTKERCYYLAKYLVNLDGGNIISKTTATVKPEDLAGSYGDFQGTDTCYSSVIIRLNPNDNSKYDVRIDIYRLCELEGTATLQGNTFKFVGKDPNDETIEGGIIVENSKAKFVVTKTTWTYLKNGDSFSFDKKMD